MALGLDEALLPFKDLFTTKTHPVSQKALSYIRGLFKSEKNRANCVSISDSLGEFDHQSVNHLLSESPWNYTEVLEELSFKARELFREEQEVALLVDEVGFRKKGKHSACVGRQYLGCIGKHDNGQVAVVAGLSQGSHYCPIDVQLFMPKKWEDDHERRKKAKIPDYIRHRTKPQMALQMILGLKGRGLDFDYLGFDSLYGSSFELIESLNSEGVLFIGDVKENIRVYLEEPVFAVPEKPEGSFGRKFKRPVASQPSCLLNQYMDTLTLKDDFEQIAFRDGTKQKIRAHFHQRQVWLCTNKQKGTLLKLKLIIRKNPDGEVKYSFCNMHQDSLQQIAVRQGQRVFVERIFEEGKNEIGMGDYQVRSWDGFHKHMTLCFLAFYYVALQKVRYEEDVPLTAPIIRKLVASTIFSRWQSLDSTMELCLQQLARYHCQIQQNLKRDLVT
ncbi:MAG: IS701 family transposase [Bacteroidetes bacterium]|nr:IS701 family transposase [Bacteroidota bacterium]